MTVLNQVRNMKTVYMSCLVGIVLIVVPKSKARLLTSEGNNVPLEHDTVLKSDKSGLERDKRETLTDAELIARLTAENNALKEDKAALQAEVHRLQIANFELTERNDRLERENNQLSIDLREANALKDDMTKQINDLKAAQATLTAERDNLSTNLHDLEDALRDCERKLPDANSALTNARAETEQRSRDNAD